MRNCNLLIILHHQPKGLYVFCGNHWNVELGRYMYSCAVRNSRIQITYLFTRPNKKTFLYWYYFKYISNTPQSLLNIHTVVCSTMLKKQVHPNNPSQEKPEHFRSIPKLALKPSTLLNLFPLQNMLCVLCETINFLINFKIHSSTLFKCSSLFGGFTSQCVLYRLI